MVPWMSHGRSRAQRGWIRAGKSPAGTLGTVTSVLGAYFSYFLNGATGGIIVLLMTAVFLTAFVFAPKHGLLAARAKARAALERGPQS